MEELGAVSGSAQGPEEEGRPAVGACVQRRGERGGGVMRPPWLAGREEEGSVCVGGEANKEK